MIDLMTNRVKLGRNAPLHDSRNLLLANYLQPGIAPNELTLSKGISDWGMLMNDTIGDCTIAGAAHLIELWIYLSTGKWNAIPDSEVLKVYETISGYNPKTGENDDGAAELSVLRHWKTNGIAGHKIGAFAAVEPANLNHIKLGTWLFSGLYVGAQMPKSVLNQKIWHVPFGATHTKNGKPGSWGGHAMVLADYNHIGPVFVTWGKLQQASWEWLKVYVDESWAVISEDFLRDGKAPNGFDLPTLQADIGGVGQLVARLVEDSVNYNA